MSVFTRFKSPKRFNRIPRLNGASVGGLLPRILLCLAVVSALSYTFFSSTVRQAGIFEYSLPDFQVGDISPRREIALVDFQVPKPPEQLEEERRRAASEVIPVYTLDTDAIPVIQAEIDSLFSIIAWLPSSGPADSVRQHVGDLLSSEISLDDIREFGRQLTSGRDDISRRVHTSLKRSFAQLYNELIVSRRDEFRHLSTDLVMVQEGEGQSTVPIDEIMDVEEAGESIDGLVADELGSDLRPRSLRAVQEFARRFIRPNLHYNSQRTAELRLQAMEQVSEYAASYKKNERIIEANVPVTASQITALDAYREALEKQTFEDNRRKHYAVALGKSLIALSIITLLVVYLYLYRRRVFASFPYLLLLTLIAALPLSVAYYAAWSGLVSELLVPVAVATILSTILFDAHIGFLMTVGVSLTVATMIPGDGYRLGVIYFIAGSVGVLTVGRVRHRKEFYRSMFFVPLTMALAVLATNNWIANPSFSSIGREMFLAALNGFFCPIIAIGLLPLLESVFKIATDITLLELSDLNNPLLRELAVKAPGTFSSVLMVGSLAEAAADRIGANSLLARVGSYYHDIGKMVIPDYFIENQYAGENPHDRLSPHMSALVIASHVKEGYELGLKYGLPQAILDIIKQHHGTSLMALIYHKAVEKAGGEDVDEEAFRYPGPRPQTREAGIVMLADLVEAASRTMHEKSPGRLKTLINTIIQKRFMDGELDECDLTLRDLHNIEESFLPVLVGSHHGRIEYPWQKEEKKILENAAADAEKHKTEQSLEMERNK